jgi:hypothetical protein
MPALLYVRLPAIPPAIEADWNRWYDDVHMAYRFDKPGFLAARRYVVTSGTPRYLALYELESVDALVSPAYLAHRDWETSQPAGTFEALGPRLPGFERGVYEQSAPAARYGVPDASWLHVAGYDVDDAHADEFDAWHAREGAAALAAIAGVVAFRRMRLTAAPLAPRTGAATGRPREIVLCDLADDSAATLGALERFERTVVARFATHRLQASRIVARCLFSHRVADAEAHVPSKVSG